MPDPIDYPWAVVVMLPDDGEVHVRTHRSEKQAGFDRGMVERMGHESHVVPLPDLLAWVRANAREGRT